MAHALTLTRRDLLAGAAALAALTLTGIPFLGTMGLVAAATVLIAVLVAWTLSPALLSLLGDRVLGKGGRAKRARALEQEQAGTQGRALANEQEQELRTGSRPRGGATSFFNPPATAQHAGASSEPGGSTSVQHEAADEDHPFWSRLVTRVPWLTVLAVVAQETQTPDVDEDDPATWPAPPTRSDGEPFTAEDLMTAEDLGQEDVLNHASSTNGLCVPAP